MRIHERMIPIGSPATTRLKSRFIMDMTHSLGRVLIRDLMESQLHYVERRVCGVASGTGCVIGKAGRTLELCEMETVLNDIPKRVYKTSY